MQRAGNGSDVKTMHSGISREIRVSYMIIMKSLREDLMLRQV